MKLAERHNTVRSNGVMGDSTQFNIEMNAKMFRVLSDTLYEDKIGSMVRELSCNAFDAHVSAGKRDVPFYIHLPSEIEPWFSVRDEGIGLSDEDIRGSLQPVCYIGEDEDGNETIITETDENGEPVMAFVGGIYNSYGESTKDQSNDQIGAFGLGSKTPFAYTDQFTVTSVHGGMKRIYIAVLGDDGIPTLSLQVEEPSDDHPGLEVLVSVDASDFNRFADAVVDQLKFFKIHPILENNFKGVAFNDINSNVSVSNDLVTIYGNNVSRYSPVRNLYVVQGGVGYRVRRENLRDHLTKEAFEVACYLDSVGAYMEFPIGSIEVTASREGISYKPRTIDSIRNRINEISVTLTDEVYTRIMEIDNEWDRAVAYNQLGRFEKTMLAAHNDFTTVQDRLTIINQTAYISLANFVTKGKPEHDFQVYVYQRKQSSRASRNSWDRERADGVFNADQARIVPEKEMVVFVRDERKAPIRRLREFWENEHHNKKMVVIETMKVDANNKTDFSVFTDRVLDRLSKTLGNVEIRRISDLPEPPRATRSRTADGSYKVPKAWASDHTAQSGNDSSRDWEPVYDLDDIDNGIFLPVDRHNFMVDGFTYRMVCKARAMGLVDGDIYAVNRKAAEKLQNNPDWRHIEEVADDLKKEIPTAQRIHDIIARAIIMQNEFQYDMLVTEMLDRIEDIPKGTPVHTMMFIYKIASQRHEKFLRIFKDKYEHLGSLLERRYVAANYGGTAAGNDLKKELVELGESVYSQFPLLRNNNSYRQRSFEEQTLLKEHMVQYINAIVGA